MLATLDREWDGLARHREFPELALDNNTSERALRGPVVGRKNYYGSGSVISAELASRAWTITATAERAGLNPLVYLRAYLDECAHTGGRAPTGQPLTRFLPWAVGTDDLTAWAHDPRPHPDHADPTGSDPTHDLHTGRHRNGPAKDHARPGRDPRPTIRIQVTHRRKVAGGLIVLPSATATARPTGTPNTYPRTW